MENLRKEIRNILMEAMKDLHYEERLYDRFINASVLEVGYEKEGTLGEYETVGTYVLPAEIKRQIIENAKLIEGYNFPKNKSYGIQLAQIFIDKSLVKYFTEDLKLQAKNKTLLFIDKKTSSNGNLVYAVIRNNIIVTIYFAKNYVPQDAKKLNVDVMIKNLDIIRQKKVR